MEVKVDTITVEVEMEAFMPGQGQIRPVDIPRVEFWAKQPAEAEERKR